ncbi:MAG TPA: AAA family ATPase [Bryobacteraceae bacterium]|nr:AAA family ATPase [Bryobacteraceae bacterium]
MHTTRTRRTRTRRVGNAADGLLSQLTERVIGQPQAMTAIAPYVRMYEAGLNPEGRPAGVFLLLGPTGTGKTRTVEALAEVLHGNARNLIRIDCGEYQLEHETAKLVGAPPGYLGHRETHPVLTQARLAAVTTQHSSLSLVLFDEVEKAAPSMTRLMLGMLDKATLRLGDNNIVNFERSLIFMTSNVGAAGMQALLDRSFGFGGEATSADNAAPQLDRIALNAARKAFAPEFLNRVDAIVSYQPLSPNSLEQILDLQLQDLQNHIDSRLGDRAFRVDITPRGRKFLLGNGASIEYGAREIKRAVHKHLTQRLAVLVTEGSIRPGARVRADHGDATDQLSLKAA